MKFVEFVKWFAKHPSKNMYKFFGVLAAMLGMIITAHATIEMEKTIWIAYPIVLIFGGGYLFGQWNNYKKMKEAEDKKK